MCFFNNFRSKISNIHCNDVLWENLDTCTFYLHAVKATGGAINQNVMLNEAFSANQRPQDKAQ